MEASGSPTWPWLGSICPTSVGPSWCGGSAATASDRNAFRQGDGAGDERIKALSSRESEILGLLAEGFTGEQIAKRLVLSPETVRTHVRNAMEKLGAPTRTAAVVKALELGEVERPQGWAT